VGNSNHLFQPGDSSNNTVAGQGGPSAFYARIGQVSPNSGGNSTSIVLDRYNGSGVAVNGEFVAIAASSTMTLTNLANLITAAGADSGAGPAVNTLYYLYVSNSSASFAPSGIRLSATAPQLVNGLYYLAASGNGLNWRFVGWIRTTSNAGTPEFTDTPGGGAAAGTAGVNAGKRLIANYYNRLRKAIGFICPNYNNDNLATTYSVLAGTSWTAYGNQSSFISNGEDCIELFAQAMSTSTGVPSAGVAVDGTDPNVGTGFQVASAGASTAALSNPVLVAAGYHTLDFVANEVGGAQPGVFFADQIRGGAARDPAMSGYSAVVMV
jgi:hypothetical protein